MVHVFPVLQRGLSCTEQLKIGVCVETPIVNATQLMVGYCLLLHWRLFEANSHSNQRMVTDKLTNINFLNKCIMFSRYNTVKVMSKFISCFCYLLF